MIAKQIRRIAGMQNQMTMIKNIAKARSKMRILKFNEV